jgi:hypothetical protein
LLEECRNHGNTLEGVTFFLDESAAKDAQSRQKLASKIQKLGGATALKVVAGVVLVVGDSGPVA